MALISAEQRAQEVQDRQDYETAEVRERERLENELRKNLSVASRLMRRAEQPQFNTVFNDDLGEFTVRSRMMVRSERILTTQLFEKLSKTEKDTTLYDEVIEGFKQLAKDLTSPELASYWESEKATDDVAIAVVRNTLHQTMRLVGEAITSFRSK